MEHPRKKQRRPVVRNPEHPTETIPVKMADVDRLMVPLVCWLNGFSSVLTMACCQGELSEGKELCPTKRPYVLFLCMDGKDLIQILSEFQLMVETLVHWDQNRGALLYTSTWPDRESLQRTVEVIRAAWGEQ